MDFDFTKKTGNLISKLSNALAWVFSKLFGLIFLLVGLFFFIGFSYFGGIEVLQQITWPSATAAIDSIQRNGSGSELMLFLTLKANDGSVRSTSMNYSVSQSTETDDYNAPSYIYEGATITLKYPKSNPSQLMIAQPIWGLLTALILSSVFVLIGYLELSVAARIRFMLWNKDWRFWWSLFLLGGLACFTMAALVSKPSLESAIQSMWVIRLILIGIGLPLFLVGGYKLIDIFKRKKVLNRLVAEGLKMELNEFNIEEDKFSVWEDPETGKKSQGAFIIKSVLREKGQELPYVFTSEPLFFDPKPYMPEKLIVYVNPNDKYEYYMDLSFLPVL